MRVLERETVPLEPLTADKVATTIEKLRTVYSIAYAWEAPRVESTAGGAGHRGRMRYKVRAAINEWDLMRLYPNARPETEGVDYRPGYQEDPELVREGEDEADDTRSSRHDFP